MADLGIRVVWQADLEDIAGTHLHPADVPGAIVSLDHADPRGSWHWAGPRWRGGAPIDARAGGVTSLTVAASDPRAMAARWAEVLGEATTGGTEIALDHQTLRFVPGDPEGIVAVGVRIDGSTSRSFAAAGVRFDVEPG